MKLYLIRHGRTIGNEGMLYCGWDDTPLSEGGTEELKQKVNSQEYPGISTTTVYTSGLIRTEQTLKLIYGDIKHIVDPEFREMHFGDFEGLSYDQLKDNPDFIKWCEGDNLRNVTPNGESAYMMAERVIRELGVLISKDENALIVCHGGPIAAIVMYLFPDKFSDWMRAQPKNGEGYRIEIENGKAIDIEVIPK